MRRVGESERRNRHGALLVSSRMVAYMTNDKDQQTEELWKMVQVFSQHPDEMKKLLETEREKNKALNAENSGCLGVCQKLQSRTGVLEAELLRLRSWVQDHQDNPQS
jgi:hypothetical protein